MTNRPYSTVHHRTKSNAGCRVQACHSASADVMLPPPAATAFAVKFSCMSADLSGLKDTAIDQLDRTPIFDGLKFLRLPMVRHSLHGTGQWVCAHAQCCQHCLIIITVWRLCQMSAYAGLEIHAALLCLVEAYGGCLCIVQDAADRMDLEAIVALCAGTWVDAAADADVALSTGSLSTGCHAQLPTVPPATILVRLLQATLVIAWALLHMRYRHATAPHIPSRPVSLRLLHSKVSLLD